MSESYELKESLRFSRIPNSLKPLVKTVVLGQGNARGYFPSGRTTTAVILERASDVFGAQAMPQGDIHLGQSIACHRHVVLLGVQDHKQVSTQPLNLGVFFLKKALNSNAILDINDAVECLLRALELCRSADECKTTIHAMLGIAYAARSQQSKEVHDIDSAIEYQIQAISPKGDTGTTNEMLRFTLGHFYALRFEISNDLGDVEKSIQHMVRALGEIPERDASRPAKLNDLGISYQYRYQRLGLLADLDRAISCQSEAVLLAPDDDKHKAPMLSSLGSLHQYRFKQLSELSDIDSAIESHSEAVLRTPDGHAGKPKRLANLGKSHRLRFDHLGNIADIDQAITCISEAVLLTPDEHVDKPVLLEDLGISYQGRFQHLEELADIQRAISFQLHAVLLAPDGHPDMYRWLISLGNSHLARFERLAELVDIDKAISFHSKAISIAPDGHEDRLVGLVALGDSHQCRFERFGELVDIDQAIKYQLEAAILTPDGHINKSAWLDSLGSSYQCRFGHLGNLADLDRAIQYHSQAVLLIPDEHASKPGRLSNLGSSYLSRFQHIGNLTDIDQAISCHSKAVSLAPDGHAVKPKSLVNLGGSHRSRFRRLGERADIDQAIKYQLEAVSLTPGGHAYKAIMLHDLGLSHQSRFKLLGEPGDIDQAIAFQSHGVLLTPEGHADRPRRLRSLGHSLWNRFELLGDSADLERATKLLQMSAQSSNGRFDDRFQASREWARLASLLGHPIALLAYQKAMELVPKLIWIGSTLNSRYEHMYSIGAVAVEAAAAAISVKDFRLALEWLEAGRSIVWSQTLQLRTQFDDLATVAPSLAESLKRIARELEIASQRDTSTTKTVSQAVEAVDQRHRRLAEDYEEKLTDARKLPGFQGFMRSKKAVELLPSAQSGPVVVVNVHSTRCDALILRPQCEDIEHLPLSKLSHDDVMKLQQQTRQLLASSGMRQRGFTSKDGSEIRFEGVLAALWHKIVEPVLSSLGYMANPTIRPLPHVTWCTTGALSFLPIHAAGCYDETGLKIYDFVVSSYSPTLSALLSTGSGSLEVGGILVVGQEATPGCPPLAGTKPELDHIQRHVKTLPHKQLEKDQATVEAVLTAMEEYSSVHLACHGSQMVDDPTKSCFHLHNGSLSLAAITRQSFKNKGLAFLSACQTASGNEEMPDEAVHLAAGMLVAGYPTVIATMWSINDGDAPLVANSVYGEIMKDGNLGDARAARALHAAVKVLRDKIGEDKFTRWVPYIHMGV